MKLVTAAQMRSLELAAADAGVSEQMLMESAGVAAGQEAWMSIGGMEGRSVLVLVGPGNNGGDGLVAARELAAWGATVYVYLVRERADDDPQWRALVAAEVPVTGASADDEQLSNLAELLQHSSLVVDALLGTGGARRPIEGRLAQVLARLREARAVSHPPRLLAVDLPSGVDPDTGAADPATVGADTTVTFGYPKVGLFAMPGRELAGDVVTVDIGLPEEAAAGLPYEEIDFRQTQRLLPKRRADAHKGTFGRVVVVGGSRRFPGAARLSAEAAARSGAGLVVLAAPQDIQPLLVHGLPDVVHEPLPSAEGAVDGAAAARALLRALARDPAEALLAGPGLSLSPATEEFVRSLLEGLDGVDGLRGAVFDADVLNALARAPGWHERLRLPRVLTPHPGEMARLTRSTVAQVQADRLRCATEYARATDSVVLLKGACTVVAAPDGRARISPAANSMLARAGTGDVLGGLIAGLIAQGMAPFDAASSAVYMHAESGRQVADAYGEAAGLAQDLLKALPDVRKLLDGR